MAKSMFFKKREITVGMQLLNAGIILYSAWDLFTNPQNKVIDVGVTIAVATANMISLSDKKFPNNQIFMAGVNIGRMLSSLPNPSMINIVAPALNSWVGLTLANNKTKQQDLTPLSEASIV